MPGGKLKLYTQSMYMKIKIFFEFFFRNEYRVEIFYKKMTSLNKLDAQKF